MGTEEVIILPVKYHLGEVERRMLPSKPTSIFIPCMGHDDRIQSRIPFHVYKTVIRIEMASIARGTRRFASTSCP